MIVRRKLTPALYGRRRFTPEEMEAVARYAGEHGVWLAAKRFGRSPASIQTALSRLGTMARMKVDDVPSVSTFLDHTSLYLIGPVEMSWTERRRLQRLVRPRVLEGGRRRPWSPEDRRAVECLVEKGGPIDTRQVGAAMGRTSDAIARFVCEIVGTQEGLDRLVLPAEGQLAIAA